jgi:hypothetical protein
MLADKPATAYAASWSGFFDAEFAANFKIVFFTSSCHTIPPSVTLSRLPYPVTLSVSAGSINAAVGANAPSFSAQVRFGVPGAPVLTLLGFAMTTDPVTDEQPIKPP